MSIKIYRISAFLLIAAYIFGGCIHKYPCDITRYKFQIGVKANPDNALIKVGDTLWFEINRSVNFKDLTSSQIINYSNAVNLGSAIGFVKFENNDSITLAANLFDNILKIGNQINNSNTAQIREYRFDEKNGKYIFKLGIVPQIAGVYSIGFSNANNVYRKSDGCSKALFVINMENTKQHFYLNPFILSSNTDTTKPSGTYYFEVK